MKKLALKLNIQKTKIMASGPITSWEIDAETVETVSDFILGGSKITADGDCSHEIKRCLLLGRKVITNLDSIMEKAMAPHSGTLAWKIPWTQEPGRLQSMGSRRIGHSWATSLSLFTFIMRLLSSSSLSAIRVVSSAYLRLFIFSQQSWFKLVLHPAQNFSWCTLHFN